MTRQKTFEFSFEKLRVPAMFKVQFLAAHLVGAHGADTKRRVQINAAGPKCSGKNGK